MTEIYNPVTVEAAIRECANQIAKGVGVLDRTYREYLAADREFDAAWAHAIIHATGSNLDARKADATLASLTQREALDNADAKYKYALNRWRALDNELRAWQSVGASVRQAYQVAGRGEQ